MQKIAALINFCSNEYPFLKPCITSLKPFCNQIIISVCDHFYDGKKEDLDFLQKVYLEYPEVTFLQYPYLGNSLSKKIKKKNGGRIFDGISRFLGAKHLKKSIDYVLFLDADEIVDTKRFIHFLNTLPLQDFNALKLCNYWYFREPKYQAKTYEDSILFAQKKALSKKVLFGKEDRDGIFQRISGKKSRSILSQDNKPLFHHYSWVRTKEQMLRKVLSWGHKNERDWKTLVEKEFSKPFSGKDFVHGYEFNQVDPYTSIDLLSRPSNRSTIVKKNLIQLSDRKALAMLSKSLYLRSFFKS